MWIPLAIGAGLGVAQGISKSKKNKKKQAEYDAFRKEAIRYSPWTQMGDPGAYDAGPTGMEAILGGGLQGASMGGMLGSMGKTAAPQADMTQQYALDPVKVNQMNQWIAMQNMMGQQQGSAGAFGGQNSANYNTYRG